MSASDIDPSGIRKAETARAKFLMVFVLLMGVAAFGPGAPLAEFVSFENFDGGAPGGLAAMADISLPEAR